MELVSELRGLPVSPSGRNSGTNWEGSRLESRAAGPLWRTAGFQNPGRRLSPGRARPAWAPPVGRHPKETPTSPSPCHPVGKNSCAQALGTVMGATCWPDVPVRARQECRALGAPAWPHPRRTGPAPARTRQARRTCTAVYFLGFPKVVCRTRVAGARLPFRPRRSPSVRLRLRVAGGPGFLVLLLHLNLQQPALLPLAFQLLPDVSQLPFQLHFHQLQRPP